MAGVDTQPTGSLTFIPSGKMNKNQCRKQCQSAVVDFLVTCADALTSDTNTATWARDAAEAMCLVKYQSAQGATGGTATQKDVINAIRIALDGFVSNTVNDEVNRCNPSCGVPSSQPVSGGESMQPILHTPLNLSDQLRTAHRPDT